MDDRPTLLCASHFGPEGMLRLKGSRLAQYADAPVPSLFWAAGFSFSRSQLLTEVSKVISPSYYVAQPSLCSHSLNTLAQGHRHLLQQSPLSLPHKLSLRAGCLLPLAFSKFKSR